MVLRHLINMFINNNPQLIEKLSESSLMRRAAQMTVYMFLKGKRLKDEALDTAVKSGSQRIESFSKNFQEEVKRGWKEAQKNAKK